MRVLLSTSLLAILGLVGVAAATPITVNNPSFEALVLTCAAGPAVLLWVISQTG